MIDDESRRRDEAFAKKLKDWKRRRHGDCKMFFDVFGEPEVFERDLAARKLVRDFFNGRADARRARASDQSADRHGHPEPDPTGE